MIYELFYNFNPVAVSWKSKISKMYITNLAETFQ